MTKDEMAALIEKVFEELRALRAAGQREYAHGTDNAFANFERTGAELGLPREVVLWVFARKHMDGIAAWIGGHRSQREDVRGRINDAIVYLLLLRGMVESADGAVARAKDQLNKLARDLAGAVQP